MTDSVSHQEPQDRLFELLAELIARQHVRISAARSEQVDKRLPKTTRKAKPRHQSTELS